MLILLMVALAQDNPDNGISVDYFGIDISECGVSVLESVGEAGRVGDAQAQHCGGPPPGNPLQGQFETGSKYKLLSKLDTTAPAIRNKVILEMLELVPVQLAVLNECGFLDEILHIKLVHEKSNHLYWEIRGIMSKCLVNEARSARLTFGNPLLKSNAIRAEINLLPDGTINIRALGYYPFMFGMKGG